MLRCQHAIRTILFPSLLLLLYLRTQIHLTSSLPSYLAGWGPVVLFMTLHKQALLSYFYLAIYISSIFFGVFILASVFCFAFVERLLALPYNTFQSMLPVAAPYLCTWSPGMLSRDQTHIKKIAFAIFVVSFFQKLFWPIFFFLSVSLISI